MEENKKTITSRVKKLLSYQWIAKRLTFFLFLTLLAVIYIANGHMADNTSRAIDRTQRELKNLEYEYKTIKSELMFKTRESEMVQSAEHLGLKVPEQPPVRIKK